MGPFLLLTCLLALGVHPVSDYRARLDLGEAGLELSIDFTWDDVYLNQQVAAGPDRRFAAEDLRRALGAFERRLVGGTLIYDGVGEPLELQAAELQSDLLPEQSLTLDELSESGGSLRLVFPPSANPQDLSILIDWGCWRESISTSIVCEFEAPDGREGLVYWRERQRYPLLPRAGDERIELEGRQVYVVPPLEETLTAFSYIYLEPDHVRHELVLPLLATISLLAEETDLSATGRLDGAQRALVRRALEESYDDPHFLWSDGRPLPASEVIVRWFTRESIEQGVVTADRPIPIATGFVGLLSVHPVDEPVDELLFDASPWSTFTGDHVVSVIDATGVERRATSEVGSRVQWLGWAAERAPAAPMELPALAEARGRWSGWLALAGGLVAAICLALRRRGLAALVAAATLAGVGLGHCAGRGALQPSPSRGSQVLAALLENVYRACGRQDEQEALSLLAQASAGSLLEELYLELRGQIRGPWATGAGTRVTAVELEECELDRLEAGRLAGRCVWTVEAAIEHWGHVHERSLRVTARLGAAVRGGHWRLDEVRLLDKRVIGAASRPRR